MIMVRKLKGRFSYIFLQKNFQKNFNAELFYFNFPPISSAQKFPLWAYSLNLHLSQLLTVPIISSSTPGIVSDMLRFDCASSLWAYSYSHAVRRHLPIPIVRIWKRGHHTYVTSPYYYSLCIHLLYASCTVQLVGIPLLPFLQDDIFDFLTNVPEEATLYTQLYVHWLADIFVARHLM